MMTLWAVLWVWALQIAVWLCLFFLFRLMCAPVFAMPEPVAVYLYTYVYTVSTVVLCLRSLTVTIGPVAAAATALNPPISTWAGLTATPSQNAIFIYVCGYELADWLVNGVILRRMKFEKHLHHLLHMIAYAGALAWGRTAHGFILHLLLSELKELAYPLLQVMLRVPEADGVCSSTKSGTVAIGMRTWLQGIQKPAIKALCFADMVLCVIFTMFLWRFAMVVVLTPEVLLVFKPSIFLYGLLLGWWLKGRVAFAAKRLPSRSP